MAAAPADWLPRCYAASRGTGHIPLSGNLPPRAASMLRFADNAGRMTMKLYNSIGPNPKTVRMFMAEKGIELPKVEIDLMGGENRREPYLSKNPAGQCPALELDDGTVITEITVICEYLDEVGPGPSLIGATPQERAVTRMWVRRIDFNILAPMADGFRFAEGLKLFENRIHCIPQAADDLKAIAREKLQWLDRLIAGRTYVCGDKLTLADIPLFAFLEFFGKVGQPLDPECRNIHAWYERMQARPSAKA
jgi:glutathione S-transferase